MSLPTLARAVFSPLCEGARPVSQPQVLLGWHWRASSRPRLATVLVALLAGVVLAACSPSYESKQGKSSPTAPAVQTPRVESATAPKPKEQEPAPTENQAGGKGLSDQKTASEPAGDDTPPKEERKRKSSVPEILPKRIVKPNNDKLAEIEYLLQRGTGVKVMRDWGLMVRATADDGHNMTLIACRLVGPGLEDGPIAVFTQKPINPVTGLAREFSDSLPNRHWSSADKSVQVLVMCAEAVRDGRSRLHSDK